MAKGEKKTVWIASQKWDFQLRTKTRLSVSAKSSCLVRGKF